jgi:hypothetical protein
VRLAERGVITAASSTTGMLGRKWRNSEEVRDRAGWEVELRVARQTLLQYAGNPRIADRARARIEAIERLLDPEAEIAAARRAVQDAHPDKGGDASTFQKARQRLTAAKAKRAKA